MKMIFSVISEQMWPVEGSITMLELAFTANWYLDVHLSYSTDPGCHLVCLV